MLLFNPNPVHCFGTKHDLSTWAVCFTNLSLSKLLQSAGLTTMFETTQHLEITVENGLVHRTR